MVSCALKQRQKISKVLNGSNIEEHATLSFSYKVIRTNINTGIVNTESIKS